MGQVSLTGADTLVLDNYVFTGQADQNWAELTYGNDIATVKVGKNGNAIFGLNAQGTIADLKVRVLRGSADDKFLNNKVSQQNSNFSGTVLIQGQFIKKIGDGAGGITSDTYIISSGVMQKQPEGKSNADGDTEQSVAIYMLKFASSVRVLT